MSWIDWMIVIIPVAFVYGMGLFSRRYVRSVADYLSAGRVCGRYIINVGGIATALSIIGIVSTMEVNYKTGFAMSFWSSMLLPLSMIMGLTGFCNYRFRETKAMSLGQFLEMRYSRKFRIFAAGLRSISEIIANSIMPAIAARFFIFFLDLPTHIEFLGMRISVFMLIMAICLFLAISIICMGGTLALLITDSIQGMLMYPIMVMFVGFVLYKFDWSNQIVPVMLDRVPKESFLNPFDISDLRDFNLFSLLILPFVANIIHRASWIGAGYSTAARSPHEAKMGDLLGTWRGQLNTILHILFAIMLITLLNHKDFATEAHQVRSHLAEKVNEETMLNLTPEMKTRLDNVVHEAKPIIHEVGVDAPLSTKENIDTKFLAPIHQELLKGDSSTADMDKIEREAVGNAKFQQYRTYFHQLQFAAVMREVLPQGIVGLFFLLMVMAMISTDDTRIYSASLTFTQDVVVPLCKKPLTMNQHVWALRWVSIGVGVIFFFISIYMAQLTYINLFVTIVCMMWTGGCGPVMIFGLYSRIGTTAAAWTSLLTGMFLSFITITIDRCWPSHIYPWLQRHDMVDSVGNVLKTLSDPLPFIKWEMNPLRCPINSYEFYFMTMIITLLLYVIVSYATCKEPFNLDRMLHRGKYNLDGDKKDTVKFSWKGIFKQIIGINKEYSTGDKAIAWGFFIFTFIYQFLLIFLVVMIWNYFSPFSAKWWSDYFYITHVLVPGAIALITTFWFGWGGIKDLIALFRALETRVVNHLDNGTVSGNMSLADKAELEAVDADNEQNTEIQK
ncbi:MAG: sodium:panthothenate symporter [Lentisphaerae bacterium]|nr:sodium:panthothenate symporter [Lentisphaerota bacterium]